MLTLHRLQTGLIASAVLALTLPAHAAEVDKYLPEDTEAVVVVNAKQLVDSSLVKKHLLGHIRELLKSNDEAAKILESLGFDPFKDLTSITAAMPLIGNDAKGLIITHGQFDKAKFDAKAEEVVKERGDVLKIHKEGDRKVYEVKVPDGDKPAFVGIVDQTTLVAGPDKQHILDAFATSEGKKKGTLKKEIQELIEKADATQSVWLAATAQAFLKGDLSSDDKAKKNLEKINSVTAGVTIDKGIKAAFMVATKSAENAKELADEFKEVLNQVKGLLTLLAEQNKQLAPLVDAVGNLKVTTEGNNISVKAEVSEEVIEKGLKKG
jgi:hypothetical protein